MLKKISDNALALAFLAGLACVLAFPPIRITSALVFSPFLLMLAVDRSRSIKEAAFAGFITSLVIMAGGFYWVVYVLHIFGHLPWIVAALLYLVFSGFGALNFPLFSAGLYVAHRRHPSLRDSAWWWVLGVPALFTLLEYLIPKLFPWYVGHAFFETHWITQAIEFTGSSFLTFLIFTWGGLGAYLFHQRKTGTPALVGPVVFAPLLTLAVVSFSLYRLSVPLPEGPVKNIAFIQANIGSLEKMNARKGISNKVQYTMDKHRLLTQTALNASPKPDLILWPETAMPFSLHSDMGWGGSVRRWVQEWKVPLISGGYAPSLGQPGRDYNAAFLLEPRTDTSLGTTIYNKNILLAFGEYFPGGELFPKIYDYLPQVSNFNRGTEQNLFTLEDGTRIGVTICYEDIVPAFFRRVAAQGAHLIVNLTNDSWFGPTSEPYQHAALSVFRAIETRTPMARVTNTGISFAVDRYGRMSKRTGVYKEAWLTIPVTLSPEPATTLYVRFGEWFLGLLLLVLLSFFVRAKYVPLPA